MKKIKIALTQLKKPFVVAIAVLALIFGASSLIGVSVANPTNFNGGP